MGSGRQNAAESPVSQSSTNQQQADGPQHDKIKQLAYFYWKRRGSPDGSPEVDWLRAEKEIRETAETPFDIVEEASKESFPASDSPAY